MARPSTAAAVPLRNGRNGDRDLSNHHALARDLRRSLRGQVLFDRGSRALYATDASNYRTEPVGVVIPESRQDVIDAVAICREHGAAVLPRGGGTSLAGQCTNAAVVIDFTRSLNRVLDVDPERRLARVEPGVVLDDLRSMTDPLGLTFGPDPSTHSHCTLGGMIGNNSCGVHAVQSEFYGPGPRTEDNVHALEALTYDGLVFEAGATSDEEFERIVADGGRRAEMYRHLRQLANRHTDAIRTGFPKIPRRVSGYNLPALLPENGFHVARALSGSEATCAITLEATVELIPLRKERMLVVAGYPSVFEAADDIPRVREFKPVGCEGMDDVLVHYMRKKGLNTDHLSLLPDGKGWLLVEFGHDDRRAARDEAERFMRSLRDSPAVDAILHDDAGSQTKLWEIRKSGLGATAFVPGENDTWPGWEDAAVPIDKLGDYLRAFRALLDEFGYRGSLYGHFAQGCVHVRIDFDLRTAEGIETYRRFTEKAADLVVGMGGSLSGEHGDGQARGDLLGRMYGPDVMEAFREFKRIFDPDDKMNPGKVIDARPRTDDLRLGAGYSPWRPETRFQYPEDRGDFARATTRCVGVGTCRRNEGGTMCPSFKVTHDERHTTRGRAHLLFEMVQRDIIVDGWRSEEVKDSLDLCLSCKGCKADCPVSVDVATYKAEFLSHYYEGRLRPRQAYAFGLIHRWARLGTLVPGLANAATHLPIIGPLAKWAAGIAPERDVPAFAPRSFRDWFEHRKTASNGPSVLLWPDTFNNYFFPGTLRAAVHVLESAGYTVRIPSRPLCCGRPLYDYGMLGTAVALWRKTLSTLESVIESDTPVVGLEPTCVTAFRDELANLFPEDRAARRLASKVKTLAEFLDGECPNFSFPRIPRAAMFQGHCHEKAVLNIDAQARLLEKMGLEIREPEPGCCGMAGAFGFEQDKFDVSRAIAERALVPALRATPHDTLIIADGFSCREQIRQLGGRQALHLAELLSLHLPDAAPEP